MVKKKHYVMKRCFLLLYYDKLSCKLCNISLNFLVLWWQLTLTKHSFKLNKAPSSQPMWRGCSTTLFYILANVFSRSFVNFSHNKRTLRGRFLPYLTNGIVKKTVLKRPDFLLHIVHMCIKNSKISLLFIIARIIEFITLGNDSVKIIFNWILVFVYQPDVAVRIFVKRPSSTCGSVTVTDT